MKITEQKYALRLAAVFQAKTGLLIRSGRAGEFTDSAAETTSGPNRKLHINGYVWASLIRRALARCENGKDLAAQWGKYVPEEIGVSPLWTEATFVEEKDFLLAVNPGNRIHRQWGAPDSGALYSDELAYPVTPLTMQATIFFPDDSQINEAIEALLDALHVIGQGIETIGGGWSYGFGRLKPLEARWAILDLKDKTARQQLWQAVFSAWPCSITGAEIEQRQPAITNGMGWTRILARAGIADGQLLAIHTDVPELGVNIKGELPDSFVFTRPVIESNGNLTAMPVITGKAFRQAVLSREIERMLRSTDNVCLNTSDPKRFPAETDPNKKRHCLCKRCLWFGDTDAGGIISVGDAMVEDSDCEVIHRVQLCEHSMQNVQLFNGEYLTSGTFTLDIVIDHSRQQETASQELEKRVRGLLREMERNSGAPPGWYRLGATATCAGQLEIKSIAEQPHPDEEARP